MLDFLTAKRMILGLKAFEGHEADEYYYLIEPLSHFLSRGNPLNLEAINELAEAFLAGKPETKATEIEPSIAAQFLAERVKPWVEDVRQRLFNSKSPPFNCVEDAQRWIDEGLKGIKEWLKRTNEWNKRREEWLKRREEWLDEWETLLKKYPLMNEGIETWSAMEKKGITVALPPWEELKKFFKPNSFEPNSPSPDTMVGEPPEYDEKAKVFIAFLDSDDVFKISQATGFTMRSVTMYILADAPPLLPPFTLSIVNEPHSLPDGTSFPNRFARVTIRGELKFEDLRSLYRDIRRKLGMKRSKRPTTKHLQLYELVKRSGDIPSQKGKVAFWKSVMREWNTGHPKDKYTTWKGIKAAYDRICVKMVSRLKGDSPKGGTQ